jgi:sulfhydrogenase subunit beta (sulfur reductase)
MASEKRVGVILNKKDFNKFFDSLATKFEIFGPSQTNGGDRLIKIDSPEMINFDYSNTKISPKEFLLPQTETLFSFNTEKAKLEKGEGEGNTDNSPNLLFGIRPCDAASISFLDKVFKDTDPPDSYYIKRRDSTKIMSFACNYPKSTCFCTSVGCAPDSEAGADIIFFELKDRYLLKPLTPAGERILADVKTPMTPVTTRDLEAKARSMLEAKTRLNKGFELDGLEKKLENFDASYWDRIYQKCLGCGICTYLCPTCYCFDITDEVIKTPHPSPETNSGQALRLKGGGRNEGGRRVRTWDSCMFSLFTLHASGHNPRPSQKERIRQRIMHKFNYAVKNYGQTFCVGCGRCINYCPVNMDIRQVIKDILEAS